MQIELTSAEVMQASMAGIMRQVQNLKRHRTDYYGASTENGWQLHIEGALGEYAVAKALGIYWPGMGQLRAGDVGDLQVRTTSGKSNRLILHPSDTDSAIYILVIGVNGSYRLAGWIHGEQGKRQEFWADPTGNRPAFFVPQQRLRNISELSLFRSRAHA